MKILKSYILEFCFILSFVLFFIKGVNVDNGRCFVEIYYGFIFLMEYVIVIVIFICLFLIVCLLKKWWMKWFAVGSYFFLVLWIVIEGYFFCMLLEDLV